MKTASRKSSAKPRLKVAFVIDDSLDSPNGVQQNTASLGLWLAAQGHRVTYLTSRSQRRDLGEVEAFSRLLRVRFNGNYVGTPFGVDTKRLKAFLGRRRFDIAYIQAPYSPLLAGRVITNLKPETRVIASFHSLPQGRLATAGNRLLRRLLWRSFGRINGFICNTETMADYFQGAWRLPVRPTVIPSTINLRPFAGAEASFRVAGKTNLLFLGRLEERKGCSDLLAALELLPDDLRRRLVCHIGGRGSLQEQVEAAAAASRYPDSIRVHGFISEADKAAFLASADLAVFPSRGGESFGISLLEALAARRPLVLAARNAGYETILGGRPELMFEASNPRALADSLADWLRAGDSRRAAALDWQARHIRNYDLQTVVGPRLLKMFHQLMGVV